MVAQVSACATNSASFRKIKPLQNNTLQKYPPKPIRPHPEFWYPIARLLSALRTLLRATAPEAFAAIAKEARAQLMAVAALVRRYIHVLAAELVLPPPRVRPPSTEERPEASSAQNGVRAPLFALIEGPARSGGGGEGEDPPALQWALLMEAAARLAGVLANPAPHARRLARRFGKLLHAGLREAPAPWHIIRRVGPGIDTLLLRIDQAARPHAWAGLWVDTS